HVELAVLPPEDERLVHDAHWSTDRHHVEEERDVLRVEPDAAVARAKAHAGGLVRAVNQIARPAEIHGVPPERVVRTGPDHGLELFAVLAMLLDDGRCRAPHGVFLAPDDLRHALWRRPAHAPNADRMRVHHLRLALLRLREIEEPHLRHVDDDALAPGVRQDVARRHDDLRALAGKPGVHAGIGTHALLISDVETSRDGRK